MMSVFVSFGNISQRADIFAARALGSFVPRRKRIGLGMDVATTRAALESDLEFVKTTTDKGNGKFVSPEADRGDQDGTLWVEQPTYRRNN